MRTMFGMRPSGLAKRLLAAAAVALPVMLIGAPPASADSFSFSYSKGGGHRAHHRHFHHRHHYVRHHYVHRPAVRYIYRPPVVQYRTVVVEQPVVVAQAPVCSHGLWRHTDGVVVEGVACRQPDGSWVIQ